MNHTSPRLRRWLLGIAILLVLAWLPGLAHAQFFRLPFAGVSAFTTRLKTAKLQPLADRDALVQVPPQESVLIVFGDPQKALGHVMPWGSLRDWVDAGGALLIATDRNVDLHDFGVSIDGRVPMLPEPVPEKTTVTLATPRGRATVARADWQSRKQRIDRRAVELVQAHYPGGQTAWIQRPLWEARWAEPYQGYTDCILLKGFLSEGHPLFADCTLGIATNRPSFLTVNASGPRSTVLAAFPPRIGAVGYEGTIGYEQAFAVAASADPKAPERWLVLSGHGVFMDGMLAQKDNSNLVFTDNVVNWLTNGEKRKYALFLHENKVIDNFDVPIGDFPMPTSRIINNLLRQLEEENFFNQLLLETADKNDPGMGKLKLQRALLIAAVLGLLAYGFVRYRRTRYQQEVSVPLVEARVAQTTAEFVAAPIKRDKLALRSNDFRMPARTLARLCFEQAQPGRSPTQPPHAAPGAGSRKLAGAVERVWAVAYGAQDEPVTADDFAALVVLVRQVQEALARKTLQWAS